MATQFFMSTNGLGDHNYTTANLHQGTSTTATDIFEFRMGDATYLPDRFECLKALDFFKNLIINGGALSQGATMPQPTGKG